MSLNHSQGVAAVPAKNAAQGRCRHPAADSPLTPVVAPAAAGALLSLIAASELALRYLDHPDVQAIGFSLPAAAVADRLRDAIATVKL